MTQDFNTFSIFYRYHCGAHFISFIKKDKKTLTHTVCTYCTLVLQLFFSVPANNTYYSSSLYKYKVMIKHLSFLYYSVTLFHFSFMLSPSPVFLTLLLCLFSLGGAGRRFDARSFCEAELLEHSCCWLPLSPANPPHSSLPIIPCLPAGRSVQGSCPRLCPREVVPAVVSCRAWSGPQARLEQDGCLWSGGLGSHLCSW